MPAAPPPPGPPLRAAEPRYGRNFDPWNSVALGHQRAEARGPPGWQREGRARKLQDQLAGAGSGSGSGSSGGGGGGGGGAVLMPEGPPGARATNSVVDMLRRPGTMGRGGGGVAVVVDEAATASAGDGEQEEEEEEEGGASASSRARRKKKKMFDGLVVHVNGSTHPLVGDHRLRQVLAENGARVSPAAHLGLGRRQVTHVILGRPSVPGPGPGPGGGVGVGVGAGAGAGAGGGLAGRKLEGEIRRAGGCGVKYVGAEWVLESVKAGRRLPETRFAILRVAARGQPSVYGAFSKAAP